MANGAKGDAKGPLPEGWEERQDEKTGRTFYINHAGFWPDAPPNVGWINMVREPLDWLNTRFYYEVDESRGEDAQATLQKRFQDTQCGCYKLEYDECVRTQHRNGCPLSTGAEDLTRFACGPHERGCGVVHEDTEEEREGEKESGEVERDRRRPDSLSSDLEPGRWQTEEVREPAGEVTLLVPLLPSSSRLSPDPILSKRARAEVNLSWCDSVLCTFTFFSWPPSPVGAGVL